MYLDSYDYQTIWKLAHNWTGHDPEATDPSELPTELKESIHRLLSACKWKQITVRNKRFQLFMDDSFMTFLTEIGHFRKFIKCLRGDIFDKVYLDSLYVKRPEVIAWCEKDYLSVPPVWQLQPQITRQNDYDASDDTNDKWYMALTDRRKQRVACLELAKKLWEINSEQTYEQIYAHPLMKQYANPGVFSFEAFKKWARPFAPDYATKGGRRSENK